MTVAPPIVNALAHDKSEVLKEIDALMRDLAELSKDCDELVDKHKLAWGYGFRRVRDNVNASWRTLSWARDELLNN